MNIKSLVTAFYFLNASLLLAQKSDKNVTDASRSSCIKIISKSGSATGTGFFIGTSKKKGDSRKVEKQD